VITHHEIRLASRRDARWIAVMSRNLIENGLGWTWTEQRVLASLKNREANVAVAHEAGRGIGFVIAKYKLNEAHIHLLAVDANHRRRGVGAALLKWVEETALVAGIGLVYLEARVSNPGARKFYKAMGYKEFKIVPGRYRGIEAGIRLGKDLWA
jgi:ribosomal-protein-alanine N-acetyltransferase